MKTVFANQELFHVFASGTQEHGRSANGNVFFNGSTLFSYGAHFPLAILYNGKALLNSDSYSVTTSKHQSQAAYALRHFERLWLPALRVIDEMLRIKARAVGQDKDGRQYARQELTRQAASYVKGMAREIENAQEKLKRARSEHMRNRWQREIERHEKAALFVWQEIAGKRSNPIAGAMKQQRAETRARLKDAIAFDLEQFTAEKKTEHAQKRLQELNTMRARLAQDGDVEYLAIRTRTACESVQGELLRKRASINAGNREFLTKDAQAKLERAYAMAQGVWQEHFGALYKEACDTIKHFQDMEYKERVARFHAREIHRIGTGDVVCRVNGETVETSQGARVPLEDALKLFKAAKLCRENGATYIGPKKIGMYQLNKIDAQGNATIGCHYLTWGAIEDCAKRYMPTLLESVPA